jgi:arylformamidase
MRIIDISQSVGTETAVWPGDQPFELAWTMQQDRGDSVNVAAIRTSVHIGTHTDGGFHVSPHGIRPAAMPLESYVGRALVIDARGRTALDETVIAGIDLAATPRILFRTRDSIDVAEFPTTFLAPTAALAQRLVAAGVKLIGSESRRV